MDNQYMSAKEIVFNLINGQEQVLCVAGATSAFKLQLNLPGTAIWMDVPGVAYTPTGAGGMSDATNVYIASFYAAATTHRVVFATQPTENYWYSIAPVTMPEY